VGRYYYNLKRRKDTVEYQITKIETYWVTAETVEVAMAAVKSGKVKPEEVNYESN
jgi:ADP-ribosylglycohydrolase